MQISVDDLCSAAVTKPLYDERYWSIAVRDVGSISIYSVKCPQFTRLPSTRVEPVTECVHVFI